MMKKQLCNSDIKCCILDQQYAEFKTITESYTCK